MGAIRPKPRATQRLRPLAGLLFCLPIICSAQLSSVAPSGNPSVPALYAQAEEAIIVGNYERAEQLLQQLIQQNSQWPGAWLDLALLAAKQARYAQAQEYLQALEDQFSPLPESISQAVLTLRTQILARIKQDKDQITADTSAFLPGQRQNIMLFGLGAETNANAGLSFGTLTLTPPEGNVLVAVDPSSRARSASSTRTAFSHYGQEPWNQGSISWQIQAQARRYGIAQLSSNEILAQSSIDQANLPGRFMVGWQSIWLDNRSAYQAPMLRWQYDIALARNCGWQQYLQTENRQYHQASYLNARWHAYRSTWRCQNTDHRSQLFVQAASELARTQERPGGDSQHRSVGLQHEWLHPLGHAEHTLLARIELHNTQDTKGYSALLENGLARQLRKTDAQIAWSAPWSGQHPWRWSVGLQKTRQRSNVEFFDRENISIETSIWRDW